MTTPERCAKAESEANGYAPDLGCSADLYGHKCRRPGGHEWPHECRHDSCRCNVAMGEERGAEAMTTPERCAKCGSPENFHYHSGAMSHAFVPAPAAGCRICGTYTCLVHDVPATRGRTEKGEK